MSKGDCVDAFAVLRAVMVDPGGEVRDVVTGVSVGDGELVEQMFEQVCGWLRWSTVGRGVVCRSMS